RVRVLADVTPGPPLPQQVPALVERLFERTQPLVYLLGGEVAPLQALTERVLLIDQGIDTTENLAVLHRQITSDDSLTTPDACLARRPGSTNRRTADPCAHGPAYGGMPPATAGCGSRRAR